MGFIWKMLCLGLLQVVFLSTVTAQIFQNIQPQIRNNQPMQYQQQPIVSSLLSSFSSTMPIGDKLGAIANVIQKTPAISKGGQRQYMAEALRQSALESLMLAANACKCNQRPDGMLSVPQQQMTGNCDVNNRAVKVKYV